MFARRSHPHVTVPLFAFLSLHTVILLPERKLLRTEQCSSSASARFGAEDSSSRFRRLTRTPGESPGVAPAKVSLSSSSPSTSPRWTFHSVPDPVRTYCGYPRTSRPGLGFTAWQSSRQRSPWLSHARSRKGVQFRQASGLSSHEVLVSRLHLKYFSLDLSLVAHESVYGNGSGMPRTYLVVGLWN